MKKRSFAVVPLMILVMALVSALSLSCKDPVTTEPPCVGQECDPDPCVGPGCDDNPNPNWVVDAARLAWVPNGACVERPADDGLDKTRPDLGITEYPIVLTFDGNTATVVDAEELIAMSVLAAVDIQGAHVFLKSNITNDNFTFNLIVSGATDNGSLKTDFNVRMGLYMNGVTIKNPNGAAIDIQNGRRVTVNLVGGCDRKNYLEGTGNYVPRPGQGGHPKGTFFSEGTVVFTGGGHLEMRSNFNHAIVVDEDIRINNVSIIIHESESDGLHANDEILIEGGNIQILSAGDAIQNERQDFGIRVTGGDITIRTTGVKSHGLASEQDVFIGGNPKITITVTGDASKGIRARDHVTITGGVLDVVTTGDMDITPAAQAVDPTDTTSSASGIKTFSFEMSGGVYTSLNTGDNSKGMSVDANADISGGAITVRARGDGIKVDGNLRIRAGSTVYTESSEKSGIDCEGTLNTAPNTTTSISRSGALR